MFSTNTALHWLESQRCDLIERLMAWSNVNSGSYHRHGIEQMQKLVEFELAEMNVQARYVDLPDLTQIDDHGQQRDIAVAPAMMVSSRPEAPFQVFLVGHLDTVFAKDSAFQQCKWIEEDKILHGPGVADMKGGLLAALFALTAFEQSADNHSVGWTFCFNPDEEIGSHSSSELITTSAQGCQIGLDFEPAMDDRGTLVSARKGSGNYTFVVKGKAAHAGRAFNEGASAIAAAADLVQQIHALNGQYDEVTLNVGQIHGGTALNSVPDSTVVRLNVRVPDVAAVGWVEDQIAHCLKKINAMQNIEVKQWGGVSRPPKAFDAKTQTLFNFVKKCGTQLGQNLQWQPSGGVCDGNNIAAAGVPVIDTLGVRGGRIHSDEEYCHVDSLVERAQLIYLILSECAAGRFK